MNIEKTSKSHKTKAGSIPAASLITVNLGLGRGLVKKSANWYSELMKWMSISLFACFERMK
jgi:hypothetical protein